MIKVLVANRGQADLYDTRSLGIRRSYGENSSVRDKVTGYFTREIVLGLEPLMRGNGAGDRVRRAAPRLASRPRRVLPAGVRSLVMRVIRVMPKDLGHCSAQEITHCLRNVRRSGEWV